jgi:H+/Cl- antiporter ClcA
MKFSISQQFRWEQVRAIRYLAKWFAIGSAIGILAGTASALLLVSLEWATAWRESHLWIILLLPLGGLLRAISLSDCGNCRRPNYFGMGTASHSLSGANRS